MTKWTCAHGFGLSEKCRECDVANARDVVAQWGEAVDAARDVIAKAAGQNVMLKVGGNPFRCQCGCNVLHRLSGERDLYACNACELQYEGE